MFWFLDFRVVWPYTDWFRQAPEVLDSFLKFLKGLCMFWDQLLRIVASILAGVHWPLFLPVAGEPNLLVLLLEAARRLFSDQIACCALAGAAYLNC